MMDFRSHTQSVYVKIAEDIAGEIRNGRFQTGERLYSRKELCERFGVSGQTAVRIQNTLVSMGLARKTRGSGIFVNYVKDFPIPSETQNSAPLRRIVLFTKSSNRWTDLFLEGVQQRANQLRIDLRIEFILSTSVTSDLFIAYPVRPDEGYIAISSGTNIHFAAGALLFSPCVNSVLIDYITPGSSCVVTDNFDGVSQLVEYAISRKCRNFIFASNFTGTAFTCTGTLNAHERELAFNIEMRHRGLQSTVIDSGSFDDLVDALKNTTGSTALLFPQDDAALRCKKVLLESGLKPLPLVMGFDDFAPCEKGIEQLTTFRVDRAGMGAAAVDLLLASNPNNRIDRIIRIPGELIVRD